MSPYLKRHQHLTPDKGHGADAGVAFGAGLEAAAEAAGLVAGGADLEHRDGSVEVDPAPAQPGQLAEA
jgi:hypothetical protein